LRSSFPSSTNPFRNRRLAHTDRISDFGSGHADLVSFKSDVQPSVCRLANKKVSLAEFFHELFSALFVTDSFARFADAPRWGWGAHGVTPIRVFNVGSTLALPAGTWKDPTRNTLGSFFHLTLFEDTGRDLAVAAVTVNGDRWLLRPR